VTLFEYLSIAYSLVFSFAALRLVSGLPHAVDRDRWSILHLANVGILLFATAAVFWAQWSARDVEWTFPLFIVRFAGPGVLYFLACTLVPDEASRVDSWEGHYFSVRTKYFGGICAWASIMVINSTVVLGTPLLHPARLVQAGVVAIGIAGLATADPRLHRAILLCALIVAAVATIVIFRPAPLAA
jgi:hypothetical protein